MPQQLCLMENRTKSASIGPESSNPQTTQMTTIHLHQLRFFSFHGVHEEERVLGNEYEVSVDIDFDAGKRAVVLEDTLNYAEVYELIRERMNIPTPLLETIGEDIANGVKARFPFVAAIAVCIYKQYPPIKAIEGRVGVSIVKKF
jgi:7,8-dihydroneopterin aldolase/epimerase/oxygenase